LSLNEFSLIERYFANTGKSRYAAKLSQGDDAAILEVPAGMQVVMSMDTLISGVHFPENTSAADIAYKSLAVNLSDLAAMAADPAWFLVSLSLPDFDEAWLNEFSHGLKQVAETYQLELVGGDTCQGPLSITVQVTGLVQKNRFVTRSGARSGDKILVSGLLGNAALGLAHLQKHIILPGSISGQCLNALNRPLPRLELVEFLSRYATAAIDLSDGLVGDLAHILRLSGVGAEIDQVNLPVDEWIVENNAYQYALTGGDDYEICFTLPAQHWPRVIQWNQQHPDCHLSQIGEISESGYTLTQGKQTVDLRNWHGYQHFD
jgi:thiamine-monophosphate kinase